MKTTFHSTILLAVLSAVSGWQSLKAANVTWDSDLSISGAQDGNGSWTAPTTNFWNGTANVTPVKGTDTIFIGNTTGGSTVTIDNGGALLNYSDGTSPTSFSNLFFNRSYTLAGNAAGDGLAIGNIRVDNGSTVSISAELTGGVGTGWGTRTWDANGGTLNVSGGGRLQNLVNGSNTASTINITAGTWALGGYSGVTPSNQATFGGGGSNARNLTVNLSSGATLNGALLINPGSGNAATTTVFNVSGTVAAGNGAVSVGGSVSAASAAGAASMGTINVLSGGSMTGVGELRVGNDNGSGTFSVQGGTVSVTNKIVVARRANTAAAVSGTLNIESGTVTADAIQFGDTGQNFFAGSTSTVNMKGGTLYLKTINPNQAFVISGTSPNLTSQINLSGGTIGSETASGGWSTSMNMNLSDADGGVTFKASNSSNVARNITLSGVLSGTGGMTKTGGGILQLDGQNTFAGNTTVNAGTLLLSGTGGMTFYIGAGGFNNSITGTGILTLNGSFTFDLTGAATSGVWNIVDVGTLTETFGSGFSVSGWTDSGSNTWTFVNGSSTYVFSEATGVLTAVPEPSTWALLAIGGMAIVILKRRRAVSSIS